MKLEDDVLFDELWFVALLLEDRFTFDGCSAAAVVACRFGTAENCAVCGW